MMPRKIALTVCFLAEMMCLSFCTPVLLPAPSQEPLVAKGLLLGEPCEPPCWEGLVPGMSTEEEVDELLGTSEYVQPGIEKDRYDGGLAIRWQPRWQSPGENMFDVQDGVLEVMRMYVDSEVTLGEVLERYGPPDKFQSRRSVHPEPVYVAVELFYPELGMMLALRLSDDDPELTPETEIVRVWYLAPAALDDVLVTLVWGKGEPLQDEQLELLEGWLEGWLEWQGYGEVSRW